MRIHRVLGIVNQTAVVLSPILLAAVLNAFQAPNSPTTQQLARDSGMGWREQYLNATGRFSNGTQQAENLFFAKLADDIQQLVRHFAKDNKRPMRGNHAKILAGVTGATFEVSSQISPALSFGCFQPGKKYSAIVRFSNASSEVDAEDASPDLRGVAVRVQADTAYDFLMTNAEAHHAKDAREAMITIMSAISGDVIRDSMPGRSRVQDNLGGAVGAFPYLVTHLGRRSATRIVDTLKDQRSREVRSLATESYWSRAPIAVGKAPDVSTRSVALKYKLEPAATDSQGDPSDLGREFKGRLGKEEVRFRFLVQRYRNERETPIEDATTVWNSPFEEIGALTIPKNAALDDQAVDSLSFNPWNVDLKAFKPLGSMNRARRVVYPSSAIVRKPR
jgi:hypothetical protein